jgi:hypothetical protein
MINKVRRNKNMWQFVKTFIRRCLYLIILCGCVLTGWYFARNNIPEEYATSEVAIFANDAVSFIQDAASPVLRSQTFSTILNSVNTPDYNAIITTIKPSQIAGLIKARTTKNKGDMLVFLYQLDCDECDTMFDDVNEFAASKTNETPPIILSVAITESKLKLVKYLNSKKRGVMFKPLIIEPTQIDMLTPYMRKVDPSYTGIPHIALIKKGGEVKYFTQSPYLHGDFKKWLEK